MSHDPFSYAQVQLAFVSIVQSVCDSGQCSTDGVCRAAIGSTGGTATAASTAGSSSSAGSSGTAPPAPPRPNVAPTLGLAFPQLPSVALKQGSVYERCSDEADPTGSIPCEPGAEATDDNDADIQSKVGARMMAYGRGSETNSMHVLFCVTSTFNQQIILKLCMRLRLHIPTAVVSQNLKQE